MGNHEALASTGNLLHTALEARSALTDVNLLDTLQQLGHPYGALLGTLSQNSSNAPLQSESSGQISQLNSHDILNSWEMSLQQVVTAYLGEKIYNFSSFGHISEGILASTSISMSLDGSSGVDDFPITGSFISAPSNLSSYFSKELSKNKDSISINKDSIGLGTVSIKLNEYHGKEPFLIKSSQGEVVTEIKPNSPLAFLHLNRQSQTLRQMSPLERIQTMTKDLKEVFGMIDNPELFNSLDPKQQAVLSAAQSATIIGISHLVPLFRRRTNLPYWKLDVLPQAVQQLHCLDSQAVSNQFGGKRQVKPEDVEMMVITPQMRQQLASTYA